MRLIYYYKDRCPMCVPMKKVLDNLDPSKYTIEAVDVMTDEGFERAKRSGITSTPTVMYGLPDVIRNAATTIQLVTTHERLRELTEG